MNINDLGIFLIGLGIIGLISGYYMDPNKPKVSNDWPPKQQKNGVFMLSIIFIIFGVLILLLT